MKKSAYLSIRQIVCFGISAACILAMLITLLISGSFGLNLGNKAALGTVMTVFAVIGLIYSAFVLAVHALNKLEIVSAKALAKIAKRRIILFVVQIVLAVIIFAIFGIGNGSMPKSAVERNAVRIVVYCAFMAASGVASLIGTFANKGEIADRKEKKRKEDEQHQKRVEELRAKEKRVNDYLAFKKYKNLDEYCEFFFGSRYDRFKLRDEGMEAILNGMETEKRSAGAFDTNLASVSAVGFKFICRNNVLTQSKKFNIRVNELRQNGTCSAIVEIGVGSTYKGENYSNVQGSITGLAHDLWTEYDIQNAREVAESAGRDALRAAAAADNAAAEKSRAEKQASVWKWVLYTWKSVNVFFEKNGKAYPITSLKVKFID